MKLSHLLAGAALAALTAGAANAQVAILEGNFDGVADVATTEIDAAEEVFASQVALATTKPAFNGEFQVDIRDISADAGTQGGTDSLGAADQFDIVITLTDGLYFNAAVQNSNFVGDAAAGVCTLQVVSGGSDGSQSVTFRSEAGDNPAACDDDITDIEFDLPIEVQGAGNISFASTAVGSGSALWSATYDGDTTEVGTQELVQVASGVTMTFTADVTATTAESTPGASGVAFDDLTGGSDAVLGTLAFADSGAQLSPGVDFDLETHLASATLAVTLATDTTSITSIGCTGATSGADTIGFGTGTTTATCSTGGATPELVLADFTDADTISILATFDAANSGTAITAQDVSATFTPTGATNVTVAPVSGALQSISREGATSASFDWVGDASAVTRNVFRCTGVAATAQPFVNISNSSAGINGTFPLTLNAVSNGEQVITNAQIGAAAGAFGRGDVTFSFAGDAAVTCERLLVGNNGTLSELN